MEKQAPVPYPVDGSMARPASEAPPAAAVQAKATRRLLFVDNIRVFLTILVILHHTMIIYAGSGSWGLYEEGRQDTITSVIGTWFCAVNQAYFMGLFLLISAYFVPRSYDRKGAGRFLKDRLIRLGIPLTVYSLIIDPVCRYLISRLIQGELSPWWSYLPGKREAVIGAGPLWFVEVLLIFSLVYVLWRVLFRRHPPTPAVETEGRFPGNAVIVILGVLLGVIAFLVRLWHPVGWSFKLLNLQFPYFVLYIALFIVGLVAYRRNWLLGVPETTGKLWLRIAIVLILLFVPLALVGGAMESDEPFRGGWHWQAMALALWESLLCLAMCIGLIYVFRRYADRQGRLARFLSPNAYAAYIIHGPVMTAVALAMRGAELYPLLKFALAVLVIVPLTFGLSSLIRKIPYTDRVL
jgi:glucan biosynthesis protein C